MSEMGLTDELAVRCEDYGPAGYEIQDIEDWPSATMPTPFNTSCHCT